MTCATGGDNGCKASPRHRRLRIRHTFKVERSESSLGKTVITGTKTISVITLKAVRSTQYGQYLR